MRVQPFQKPDRFIACPHCGKGAYLVSHLKPSQQFGPWYCDDCGGSYSGRVLDTDTIELELREARCLKTVVTLHYDPADGPFEIDVKGMRFKGIYDDENPDKHDEYFYNEHTCPTNYLNRVIEIRQGENPDPHGIFRYVRTTVQNPLADPQ